MLFLCKVQVCYETAIEADSIPVGELYCYNCMPHKEACTFCIGATAHPVRGLPREVKRTPSSHFKGPIGLVDSEKKDAWKRFVVTISVMSSIELSMSLTAWILMLLLVDRVSGGPHPPLRRILQQDYCDPVLFTHPPLANCISCPGCTTPTSCVAACATCVNGYFVAPTNPSVCTPCLADCSKCESATSCSRCHAGKFFFPNPTPACRGSIEQCGDKPPATFQPYVSGGLSLAGVKPQLLINIKFSNYFRDVVLHYRTCNQTIVTGPTADDGEYCQGEYTAMARYLEDCSFKLEERETTLVYRGVLDIEVRYDVYFLGVVLDEPGYLKRPIAWRLTFNKLVSSDVTIAMKNNNPQCYHQANIVYGAPTNSVECNCQGCADIGSIHNETGASYMQCVCDACHTGPNCELDHCAPSPSCPSGTLTILLTAGLARADAKLGLLSPALAFVPWAVDNNATGWSDTAPTALLITRSIGASTQTVVQALGGWPALSDDLLSMAWPANSFELDTLYTVSYSFVDAQGNAAACSFQVQLKDLGQPAISCPADLVTNTMPTWLAQATDDVDPTPTITQTAGEPPGNVTKNTQQSITLRATDASGNYAECSFSVTYDTTPPSVVCPADPAIDVNVGSVSGTYTQQSWTAIQAAISFSDAGSGLVGNLPAYGSWSGDADGTTYTQQATNAGFYLYQPGGGANVGNGGRKYTHWDLAGNSAQCILRVKVTDVTPPTVTCPPQQNKVAAPASNAVAITGWAALFAKQDNVGVTSSTSLPATASFAITSGVRGGQPWNVTYTATDAAGFSGSCYTLVYVQDTQNPTVACPASLVVPMDTGITSYTVPVTVPWGHASSADNDGVASVVHNAPATLVPGANTITYTVTDHTGLTAACSFTVTVKDMERPTFNPCPSTPPALTRYTQPGVNYWAADFRSAGLVAYQDNDQINQASLATNYLDSAHMVWTAGSDPITVNYYIEDASKNNATCRFTVNIVDNQAPSILCHDWNTTTDNGSKVGTVSPWNFASSDNADTTVDSAAVNYAPANLSFTRGKTLIQASVTDEEGNIGYCNFTVTVKQRCGDRYVADGEECDHQSANNPNIGVGCRLDCTCDREAGYFPKSYSSRDCLIPVYPDQQKVMAGENVVIGGGTVSGTLVSVGGVNNAVGNTTNTSVSTIEIKVDSTSPIEPE
eukprot:g4416.t1